jgi:hypothetical protein
MEALEFLTVAVAVVVLTARLTMFVSGAARDSASTTA